jgi:hypothetical protein
MQGLREEKASQQEEPVEPKTVAFNFQIPSPLGTLIEA